MYSKSCLKKLKRHGLTIVKNDCHCLQSDNNEILCPKPLCPNIDFIYDFRRGFNEADFDFIFGNDGTVNQNASGLTINSVPFTQTVPVGNEHPKWLKFYKETFELCEDREVVFEIEMSGSQVIDSDQIPELMRPRIRNVNDDIRLCSGAFNIIDPNTWMVFDFFVTNTAIYAFYERLPFGKPAFNGGVTTNLGDYAAFSNAIWVARRSATDPLDQFRKLAIGIHKGKGLVTWYIDGVPVFTWDRIGYRAHDEYRVLDLGGQETLVTIDSVRMGFGTFSLLDMALPNDYDRAYVEPVVLIPEEAREIARSALVELELTDNYRELFPDPLTGLDRELVDPSLTFAYVLNQEPDDNKAVKLFGQGAVIKVKYIRAFTRPRGYQQEFSRVNR
ncbi:hypothetical protein QLL95_gp0548 [Cotonvirus japonicus]|uniref:Uncharacterized protein n=1 Tax=Cotonvirus japonicus TaxID=2811091 RepID=A0ABM7NTS6_9VIRU|nr:hypothetical protein QLL95_gp0548 [Cotonvirus japonicus]BCS83575.1 hypothetical protein [Cotonvirus japonicus]